MARAEGGVADAEQNQVAVQHAAASTSPPATTLVVQVSVSTGSRAKAAAVVTSLAFEAGIKSRPSFSRRAAGRRAWSR